MITLRRALGCVSALMSWGCASWQAYETEHLIIHYEPDSYASSCLDRAVKEYEAAYRSVIGQVPGADRGTKIKVYLHESLRLGGYAKPRERSAHYLYSEKCKVVSAHEMMHVVLCEMNPGAPLRLEEGVCRYFEIRTVKAGDGTGTVPLYRLAKLAPPGRVSVTEALANDYETDEEGNVAAAFVAMCVARKGMKEFWECYRRVDALNAVGAFEAMLGMDQAQVEMAFKVYVASLEDPPAVFRSGGARKRD